MARAVQIFDGYVCWGKLTRVVIVSHVHRYTTIRWTENNVMGSTLSCLSWRHAQWSPGFHYNTIYIEWLHINNTNPDSIIRKFLVEMRRNSSITPNSSVHVRSSISNEGYNAPGPRLSLSPFSHEGSSVEVPKPSISLCIPLNIFIFSFRYHFGGNAELIQFLACAILHFNVISRSQILPLFSFFDKISSVSQS